MYSLKDAKVLVVDDEPDLCEMLAFEFELQGSQALHAYNGKGALHIVETTPVDAVVTDLRMADGSGLELLDSIRQRDPQTPPVLFITAYDSELAPIDVYDRGAEGIFAKPFPLKELVERVRHILETPEERWSTPVPQAPVRDISREFPDLESARRGRLFALGRGGMAVTAAETTIGPDDQIAFCIHLDHGLPSVIKGVGLVRWVMKTNDGDSHILGIEFEYLDDASRAEMAQWLKSTPCRSFIPKL